MPKKHQEVDVQQEPLTVNIADGEPLYEADAYGSPQPDAGSDVTVMKQVGIGGPVPIVAPKHNTIQLQPIVVPLAVVPYMTQDSNVLRTDARQGGYENAVEAEEYREATEFDAVERRRAAKKKRKFSFTRLFAFISFIITGLFIVPFFLSYKTANIGAMSIAEFDVIGTIRLWISGGFNIAEVARLIYVIVMGLAGIQVVLTALGVIIGKYPKPIAPIISFLNMGCFIGLLIYEIVKGGFVAADNVGFSVMLAVAAFNFVLTVVFSVLLNIREDRDEQRSRRGLEI